MTRREPVSIEEAKETKEAKEVEKADLRSNCAREYQGGRFLLLLGYPRVKGFRTLWLPD